MRGTRDRSVVRRDVVRDDIDHGRGRLCQCVLELVAERAGRLADRNDPRSRDPDCRIERGAIVDAVALLDDDGCS